MDMAAAYAAVRLKTCGDLQASYRSDGYYEWYASFASYENPYIGFRVVQAVPEPSSVIAVLSGIGSLLALRRRKA